MVITEKIKKDLQAFMSARAVAGEGSLKTWGRMQKPPITGSQAEQVADALVEDGVLEKEERASGYVWRKKVATAPVSQENEVSEESEGKAADEEATSPPASVERTGEVPAPCQRCNESTANAEVYEQQARQAQQERDNAKQSYEGLRMGLALVLGQDQSTPGSFLVDHVRLLASDAQRAVNVQRPIVEGGAITAYLLDLTDGQWSIVLRERHHLSEARQLRAKATELEERAARTLEGLLDAPAPQASALALCPAPSGATPQPPPAPDPEPVPRLPLEGTLQARVLDLVAKGFDVAPTLAKKLHETHQRVTSALGILRRKGLLDCPAPGRYALAKSVRRAA